MMLEISYCNRESLKSILIHETLATIGPVLLMLCVEWSANPMENYNLLCFIIGLWIVFSSPSIYAFFWWSKGHINVLNDVMEIRTWCGIMLTIPLDSIMKIQVLRDQITWRPMMPFEYVPAIGLHNSRVRIYVEYKNGVHVLTLRSVGVLPDVWSEFVRSLLLICPLCFSHDLNRLGYTISEYHTCKSADTLSNGYASMKRGVTRIGVDDEQRLNIGLNRVVLLAYFLIVLYFGLSTSFRSFVEVMVKITLVILSLIGGVIVWRGLDRRW